MYPTDNDPATSPPPRRMLRRGWRIAATSIAAAMLVAAGTGIGLAFADGGRQHGDAAASPHDHDGGQHGTADESRQAWAQQYGQDRKAMPNRPDVASATPEQQAAAADLLARTKSATAIYADIDTAQAAGFDLQAGLARAQQRNPNLDESMRQVDAGQMPTRMPMLHVVHKANRHDGSVLDAAAPETLMYAYEGVNAWRLVGVMYLANESYPQAPPSPGGPITRWHYHGGHDGGALMMHIFFVEDDDLAHAYSLTMAH